MSAQPPTPGPFRVRNFRLQWPADLATSWAFEMETLILGWYVLVETRSVLLLTLFASLQYTGTLIAPVLGMIGDRVGHRNMLCGMRLVYLACASTLMSLALAGVLGPVHVFAVASIMGLVRPSDQVMRYSVIGAIMPPERLTVAIGISRTTMDSARVVGALAGAGLMASLGMGHAYAAVAALYAISVLLTFRIRVPRPAASAGAVSGSMLSSAWRDLREGIAYVWRRDHLLACMCLAFLVNMTAFPLVLGLMPYVAREIYQTDQTGLGYLVASFAVGALVGSLTMARIGARLPPARTMLVFCAAWYVMIIVFAHMPTHTSGCVALALTGLVQSLGMVAMSSVILRHSEAEFRGRVMGIRMLAIYSLPIGLVAAGQLIPLIGYPAVATIYSLIGIAFTAGIALYWRSHVWRLQALANAR